jgi:hypothetical protein
LKIVHHEPAENAPQQPVAHIKNVELCVAVAINIVVR